MSLDIYNRVRQVPTEAKKEIIGGRLKGFTDINPMWRIKILTETFGMCGEGWYTEILDKRLEKGAGDEVAAFMDINLFVKIGDDWSKPIFRTGGSSFVTKEKMGQCTSDECFKMAHTDALSVAAKALGVGADIYYEKDRSKYDRQPETPKQPEQKPNWEEVEKEMSELQSLDQLKKYWSDHKKWQIEVEFILLKDRHKERIDETQTK